ncbi:MAG: hypothetical protein KDA99_05285, partial [Planctomycetales bacterium]|nr:hypothetical protein [Planctomycetales bacterium]
MSRTILVMVVSLIIELCMMSQAWSQNTLTLINGNDLFSLPGFTVDDVAEPLVDTSNGLTYVANSATTEFTNYNNDPADSELSSLALFTHGSLETNTPLPPENNYPASQTQAVYDGGGVFEIVRNPDNSIRTSSGVCLCTGLSDDNIVTGQSPYGVGLQGPNNGVAFSSFSTDPGEVSTD